MRRRVVLLGIGAAALARPLRVLAQAGKVSVIGFLGSESPAAHARYIEAFRTGLREAGYTEGKNVKIEYRWAEGKNERLPVLAADLVRLKPDVIVTHGTPGTIAASKATSTIPIVMASSGDALATGLVSSLSQPSGNVTGLTLMLTELSAKRLELMKQISPRMSRVGSLFNPRNPAYKTDISKTEAAAASMKVKFSRYEASSPADLEGAFAAMARERMDAVLVHQDGMLNANPKPIADLARKHKLLSGGF